MPCAIPPVDQASSQLGWGYGWFRPNREARIRDEERVIRTFPPLVPTLHHGIDFMADAGAPVVAPYHGTVHAKGYNNLRAPTQDATGHWLMLRHVLPGGAVVFTSYNHLREASPLSLEQFVAAGDLIGRVGRSGLADERARPRLYFQASTSDPCRGYGCTDGSSLLGQDPGEVFFGPLGLQISGSEPRTIPDWDVTPPFGGRLLAVEGTIASSSCPLPSGTALTGYVAPSSRQQMYSRYGATRLTSTQAYPPSFYGAASSSSSGGGLLLVAALALGGWWLLRR